jgi:Na+/phosphate symporter
METQIVIFLALVTIALVMNTALIFLVYKALSGIASKVTEGVSEYVSLDQTKEWMTTLRSASEQAIAITETTKLQMAAAQPVIENAEKNYRETLKKVDSTLDTVADQITTSAKKARDAVSGPAFSFLSFAASLIENIEGDEE